MLVISCYGKFVYLLRDGFTVAKYDISYNDNDTEDRNKMFAFAVVTYFTKQIDRGLNNVIVEYARKLRILFHIR